MTFLQHKANNENNTTIAKQIKKVARLRHWIHDWLDENSGFNKNEERTFKNLRFQALGLHGKIVVPFLKDLEQYLGYSIRDDMLETYSDIESFCWRIIGNEPIAIIGMSCRLPGADSIEEFWNLLKEGKSGISDASERWNMGTFYNPDPAHPGTVCSKRGGFIKNIDKFDAKFFKISPREAAQLDPRQRIMLELSWEALEDSGIPPLDLKESNTGVYIATLTEDFSTLLFSDLTRIDGYSAVGTADSVVANRISYALNLNGPSIAIDTACSGSLVAIKMAAQDLRNNNSSLAIAGGIMLNLIPDTSVFFTKAGALSVNGKCKTFDDKADGIVRSDGAGVIVLKRLSDAIKDENVIHAIIRGGAINNDGKTMGIMQPSQQAQEKLLKDAYCNADLSPLQVQHIEAHGTATKVGDPVETNAIANVIGEGRSIENRCTLGSVKTNLGHMEAAAGIGGMIKVLLAIRHRKIPKVINFTKLNSAAKIEERHIYIQNTLGTWPNGKKSLIAGISSFGFGGTNAHIVIEEAMRTKPQFFNTFTKTKKKYNKKPPFHFFTLSARNKNALKHHAQAMLKYMETKNTKIEDVCYTLNRRRSHLESRMAIVTQNKKELCAKLLKLLDAQDGLSVIENVLDNMETNYKGKVKLAMVFSGQGSHWPRMGYALYKSYKVFRKKLQMCDAMIQDIAGFSVIQAIFHGDEKSDLDLTEITQLAIFAIQISLASLWKSLGIIPAVVVGHSLGEIAAAYVVGALSLRDAASIVYHRSQLMKTTEGKGKTLAVGITSNKIINYLDVFKEKISIAGSNSPESCILSGDSEAIEKIQREFEKKNIFCRLLEGVNVAFHSYQMEPLKEMLIDRLIEITPITSKIPVVSTVTGKVIDTKLMDAVYWGNNLRYPFKFTDAFASMLEDDFNLFLEVSPHPVLGMPMQQCLKHFNHTGAVFSTLRKKCKEKQNMTETLCQLYMHGYNPDWTKLTPTGKLISLPKYPWQRERYWFDQLNVGDKALNSRITCGGVDISRLQWDLHPLLGSPFASALNSNRVYWQHSMTAKSPYFIKDHKVLGSVIVPGSAYLEMAITAAKNLFGKESVQLSDVVFIKGMPLRDDQTRNVQVIFDCMTEHSAKLYISSRKQSSNNDSLWTLHVKGTVDIVTAKHQNKMHIKDLENRFKQTISSDDHYSKMKDFGLEYGKCFQAVERIAISAEEVLGYCKVPESIIEETRFNLNPILMDAAFQTVIHILLHNNKDEPELNGMYLPAGVEKLNSYGKTANTVWCHVKLVSRPNENKDNLYIVDIKLINDIGEIMVEGYGFKFMRVDKIKIASQTDIYDIFSKPQWIEIENNNKKVKNASTDILHVIFTDKEGAAENIENALKEKDIPCIKVIPGNEYKDAGKILEINAKNKNDFLKLVKTLSQEYAEKGITSCNYIYMWGVHDSFVGEINNDLFTKFHSQVSIPLLYLVQALSAAGNDIKHKLWVITREGLQVNGTEDINLAASLCGMGNVILNEHTNIWGGVIDIDEKTITKNTTRIIQYLNNSFPNEKHIAIRKNKVFSKRLVRQKFKETVGELRFRKNATYLITGGFGGIGSLVAKWMVQNGAAHLLIVGRSDVPQRTEWNNADHYTDSIRRNINTIQELESLGASVHTIIADISDQETFFSRLKDYEAENRPEIKGVIHTAGVLKDRLMMNMEAEDIIHVTLPKILGSWNLHKFFQNRNIEIFQMFSSISSITGMVGQANYAMGNAFMDSLAHYRNQKKMVGCSINWGPWAEVGMAVSKNLTKQHNSLGMRALKNDDGIKALSILTQQNPTQVTAAWMHWNKFKELYPIGKTNYFSQIKDKLIEREINPDSNQSDEVFYKFILMNEDERHNYVSSFTQTMVAKILGYDVEQINVNADFNDLGMDSIAATQIQEMVSNKFGINISIFDFFNGASIERLSWKITTDILESEVVTSILDEIENSEKSLDKTLERE